MDWRTATRKPSGTPLFLQISDTHIGFNKDANPDVAGTLETDDRLVNAMPRKPALILHTGDITHLTKPAEFDTGGPIAVGFECHRTSHRARRA